MYFENPGPANTEKTLEIAAKRAGELGIEELVLATTTGRTARKALEICPGMKITAVSYHAGFKEPFKLMLPEEERQALEEMGVQVVCATHALSGVERGLSKRHPGIYPVLLVADTLKLFGHGLKVAVEVSIMAADAGKLSGKRIVAVGGSGKGCDTALVLTPACQSDFFDMRIHEILCKPDMVKTERL